MSKCVWFVRIATLASVDYLNPTLLLAMNDIAID